MVIEVLLGDGKTCGWFGMGWVFELVSNDLLDVSSFRWR